MKLYISILILIGFVALIGCRSTTPTPVPTIPPTPPPTATPITEASVQPVPSAPPPPSPTPTPAPIPTRTPIPTPNPSPTPAPLYLQVWKSVPGANALERSKPALASIIVSLPWIADGISLQERANVGQLVNAAMLDEMVFVAVVDKPWVQDGLNEVERGMVQDLTRFSNQFVASRIAGLAFLETAEPSDNVTVDLLSDLDLSVPRLLPAVLDKAWVADGLDEPEREVIDALWGIAYDHHTVAMRILAMPFLEAVEPDDISTVEALLTLTSDGIEVVTAVIDKLWVEDGLEGLETEAIDWIGNFSNAEVALAVLALGWVQDGIEELEVQTIEELSYIDFDDADLALAVVDLAWAQDGIEKLEFEAIDWLGNFSDVDVAASVVDLIWVQDGIEDLEVQTIEELSYINYDNAELASSVVDLAWAQDGIEKLEFEAISWLRNFSDVDLALAVVDLTWVQDGIEEIEVEAIGWVNNFGGVEVASSVVTLAWVQDGIEELEVNVIEELSYIDYYDAGEALRIVAMPFLQTLEPPDISALDSLSALATFRHDDFQRVLSHPIFRNGITNYWAKIVATLYGVSDTNPALIDTLLDPNQVTLEERIIELPLTGQTHLAIIRTDPGSERSMDLLQQTVQSAEKTMAMPFPTNYVAVLFEEGAVTEGAGGVNFGTHIGALPTYDKDNDSYESAELAGLLVHEVAHYYWRGNPSWIDEGLANTMGDLPEDAHVDNPVGEIGPPCGYARTIAALEAIPHGQGDDAFTCNYTLGERLFLDLYRNLGESSFREGLRDLYMLSRTVQEDDTEDDAEIGIEHVKTAFKGDEDSENALVDLIAARWYDGTVPYDTSARDAAPPDPRFRTVNGRIDVAYLAATDGGTPTTSFSAQVVDDWAWLFLDYSYSLGSGTREVALELVDYYEDGFAFDRRHVSFTADADFIGGSWWLPVGQSPSELWAPGEYRLHVYNEGRKLVELEYEVTP